MSPRQEQVDALLGNQTTFSEKAEELLTEKELGLMRIDVGNRKPLAVGFPNASGDDGMDIVGPLTHKSGCRYSRLPLVFGSTRNDKVSLGGALRQQTTCAARTEGWPCRSCSPVSGAYSRRTANLSLARTETAPCLLSTTLNHPVSIPLFFSARRMRTPLNIDWAPKTCWRSPCSTWSSSTARFESRERAPSISRWWD